MIIQLRAMAFLKHLAVSPHCGLKTITKVKKSKSINDSAVFTVDLNKISFWGKALSVLALLGLLSATVQAQVSLPGKIQAEDFVNSYDTTGGNIGGHYRSTNTDIDVASDTGGGYTVGWIEPGEWLEYNVNITQAGNYTVTSRVASGEGNANFRLLLNGNALGGSINVPNTGGWQTWSTLSANLSNLSVGTYTLRVQIDAGHFNLNWLEFVRQGTVTPVNVPGKVEVENYVNFYDTTGGNTGGAYRSDNVDIETTSDTGGGYNVGWIDGGEWLEYAINVTSAGTYSADVRVAAGQSGGQFSVEIDGVTRGVAVPINATGGWQTWTNKTVNLGNLTAGSHTLRIAMQSGPFNINWVNLTRTGVASASVVSSVRSSTAPSSVAPSSASPSSVPRSSVAPSSAAPSSTPTTGSSSSVSSLPAGVNCVPEGTTGDWLRTVGNNIVDRDCNPVWLTGANWFGFNAGERVFHGLWSVNMEATVKAIAERGINILRVPISTQLLKEWKDGQAATTSSPNGFTNAYLTGLTTLQIFDQFLTEAQRYGMKVMLDVHSAAADNSGHLAPMWYGPASITPEDFYNTWEWVANRYKNNDTLVAFDMENEPHGKHNENPRAKWDGSTDVDNWKYACETASKRVLAIHPKILVMCEGIEIYPKAGKNYTSTNELDYHFNWWGGNLRGVKDFPINLGANQDQLLYSPHDYGPLVYLQPWFTRPFDKQSLFDEVWQPNWFFIHEDNTAPLLLGEWGGRLDGGNNTKWMTHLRDFIGEHYLHHTFWCINPNSGDTGGLMNDDWTTWDETKYALVKPVLWKNSAGKFVGLDHDVALGGAAGTGITVTQYYANNGAKPVGPIATPIVTGGTPTSSAAPSSVPRSSVAPSSTPVIASSRSSTPSSAGSSVFRSSSSLSSETSDIGHQTNPYLGADKYVNPNYATLIDTSIARVSGNPALIAKMNEVKGVSTAVWLDRIEAINGGVVNGGRASLEQHLLAAVAAKRPGIPMVIELVIYNLPDRDCSALASNGTLSSANDGLNIYKIQYIDVIAALLEDIRFKNLRIVTIIEPDSLPNMVTNTTFYPKCQAVNANKVYEQATSYAIQRLTRPDNVYIYLDVAHSGWLGWDTNMTPAITLFKRVVQDASSPEGLAAIDGFISNVANTTPVSEPFLPDAELNIGGQQLKAAKFYEYNPMLDERRYVNLLKTRFIAAGFPSDLAFLIDTSRNGWGGAARPTAVSTSTVLDTYVDASRVDRRFHRGNWCNPSGSGMGARPQALPFGAADAVEAFVWIKPPGESDGTSDTTQTTPDAEGKSFDRMCDPTYVVTHGPFPSNKPTGALAGAPSAGYWFHDQFVMLVNNAFPALTGTTGGSSAAATSSAPAVSSVPTSSRSSAAPSSIPLSSMANSSVAGVAIPGIVQAEDFTNYYDTTNGNTGGAYRSTNVDIEPTTDVGGGHNVGWIDANEWLEFAINVTTAGNYTAKVRVASGQGGGMFTLEIDGITKGTANSVTANGWQTWSNITVNLGSLSAGAHTLRVQMQSGPFNLNWIELTRDGATTSSTPTSSSTSSTPSGTNKLVSGNGQLRVQSGNLVNAAGQNFQLRGMSSLGLQWSDAAPWMNIDSIRWLRDDWNTNMVRAAMYTKEGGYIDNPSVANKVWEMIDAAIALDMYVLVDWHILSDNDPNIYVSQAKTFFQEVATRYGNKPNIIYEIANEPNGGGVTWNGSVKPYAEQVIPVIRAIDPDGVIIVGTPTWSQDVDAAANNPLSYANVMYAIHFYTCTHGSSLRDKVNYALSKGVALFSTEWGTSAADGSGGNCLPEATTWLDFLDSKNISWANWSLSVRNETSAALRSGASTNGSWATGDLTTSGNYVRNRLRAYPSVK